MGSQSKGQIVQRQWEMLQHIAAPDQPGISAGELAEKLEGRGYRVTLRTVERDLESLRSCLPLDVSSKTRPLRWRWRRKRGVDIPGMEAAEAMALFITRDAIRSHLPSCFEEALKSRFEQADKTLGNLARTGARIRWSDRVRILPAHLVLRPPAVDPKLLETLQKALLENIVIEAEYQSLKESAPSRRVLFPRALVLRGSSLYLVAHQKDGGPEAKYFAVQRFKGTRLRETESWPSAAFSLDQFLADGTGQFGDGREIQLKARISAYLHSILVDSALSTDMTLVARGKEFLLTATVRDTWVLHNWILAQGENICVLQPVALRKEIARRVKAAASGYD